LILTDANAPESAVFSLYWNHQSHWNDEVMEATVSPLENWQVFLEPFFEKLGKLVVFLEIF
jgi:hypothetical protein